MKHSKLIELINANRLSMNLLKPIKSIKSATFEYFVTFSCKKI
jgi:hypothetical protein